MRLSRIRKHYLANLTVKTAPAYDGVSPEPSQAINSMMLTILKKILLEENMSGGICIRRNFQMSTNLVFMEKVHQLMNYLREVKNDEL